MRRLAGISEACALAIVLGVVVLCAFHPLYAVDFFWHLELGQLIARTHSIPNTNLFSAAEPARPYVQFNWLWDLGAAAIVNGFGLRGVRVAQAALMAGTFAALFGLARSRSPRTELAWLVTALGLVWFEDRFQERPASLVLAFSVALMVLLFRARETRGGRTFAWLAVLGVVWSNIHGGESLLLPLAWLALLLGEWTNRSLLERRDTHERVALLGLGVAAVSLMASPTFVPGLLSWSHTIGAQIGAGNEEWQPAYTMLAQGGRPAFVVIALGPSLVALIWAFDQWQRYRHAGKAALDGVELCVCSGALVLAHQAVRNVFLSLIPLLFLIGRASPAPARANRTAIGLAAAALIGIAAEDALVYSYASGPSVAEVMRFDLAPEAFPELAADFASEAGLQGGIVNDGHWGGYLIWRLWPSCPVFADSRHHFTPEMWRVFNATHDALARPAGLEHAFARYATELTMFRGPTFPLGAPPNFRLLYKAGDQEVYQDLRGRNAAANLARVRGWLSRQGAPAADDPRAPELPELARSLGARRYLASAYPTLIAERARRDLGSTSAAVRGKAHQTLAGLFYRTGDHAAAGREFARALAELPDDTVLRYQAAQNTFASGDYAAAQPALASLLRVSQALSTRQLRRVHAMLTVIRRDPVAPRLDF